MALYKGMVYLTRDQYTELVTNGTYTADDGTIITYSDNMEYAIPDENQHDDMMAVVSDNLRLINFDVVADSKVTYEDNIIKISNVQLGVNGLSTTTSDEIYYEIPVIGTNGVQVKVSSDNKSIELISTKTLHNITLTGGNSIVCFNILTNDTSEYTTIDQISDLITSAIMCTGYAGSPNQPAMSIYHSGSDWVVRYLDIANDTTATLSIADSALILEDTI